MLVPSFRVFGLAGVLALVAEFDGGRRKSFADDFQALVERWKLFGFHNRDSIVFTGGLVKLFVGVLTTLWFSVRIVVLWSSFEDANELFLFDILLFL